MKEKKTINFLIFGDIFGTIGKKLIKENLSFLKNKNNIDIVIANSENVTKGKSMSKEDYIFLKNCGVDYFTSGNHIYKNKSFLSYANEVNDVLVPLNWNSHLNIGSGSIIFTFEDKKIRLTNLLGRSFMSVFPDNPFTSFEKLIENDDSDIHIVDFHAETTAEKLALAYSFDGKITCLYGTHTHVQTVDNRILKKGTAFISDVGITGPIEDSIIGINKNAAIEVCKNNLLLNGSFIESLTKGVVSAIILKISKRNNLPIEFERLYFYEK